MLSEKPWKPHSIIFLLAGIFVCISITGLLVFIVVPKDELNAPQWKLFTFLVTTVGFQGGLLLCIAGFLREHKIRWSEAFGFKTGAIGSVLGLGILMGIFMTPIAWILGKLSALVMQAFEVAPQAQQAVETLRQSSGGDEQIRFGVLAVLLAPVVEEMLFRGIIYPSFKQAGFPRSAVFVSSLLFGAIHGNVMSFVPLTLFGIVLVGLYEATDNLLAPICAHATFNLINFVVVINPGLTRFLPSWLV